MRIRGAAAHGVGAFGLCIFCSPIFPRLFPNLRLVVKAVAHFDKNLPRVVPVEAAEGHAVVEFDAAVGDIQGVQRRRNPLAEILAEREIKGGVAGQVFAGIGLAGESVAEAGTVIDVGGGVATAGEE